METQTEVLRTFETDEEVALELGLPAGRIEVEAVEGTTTTVELSPLDGKSSTVRAIEDATIEVRTKKGSPRLHVAINGRRLGSSGSVLMRVRCPEGRDLDASAASGDVVTHGRLGSVEIQTASGEIALDTVDRDLKVKSASGDMEARAVAGRVSVDTASGDISIGSAGGGGRFRSASGDLRIGEASGSFSINSASGDQVVESMREGDLTIRSASGDVELGVARGSTVTVDARSMSGQMVSEIDLSGTPDESHA